MDECCVTCENEKSNSWSGSSKSLFLRLPESAGLKCRYAPIKERGPTGAQSEQPVDSAAKVRRRSSEIVRSRADCNSSGEKAGR